MYKNNSQTYEMLSILKYLMIKLIFLNDKNGIPATEKPLPYC